MDFATYLSKMYQWGYAGTPESCKCFVNDHQITKEQYNNIFKVDFDTNQPINPNNNQQSTQNTQQSSSNEQKQSTNQSSGQGQPFTNNQAK